MRVWIRCVRRLAPAVALALVLGPIAAQAASTAGGASLQIPPGARAEGMGRFFAAVANDAFAPWWNPAGLAFMPGLNAGLMHTKLVPDLADDVYYDYASFSGYLKGWGGIAGTFTYLNYGDSPNTSSDGGVDLGTFSSFEVAPSIAIGTPVVENVGLGLNLKLLHVDLAGDILGSEGTGTTFAVDLGGLYQWTKPSDNLFGQGAGEMTIRVGATVANLGPNISLVDKRQSDPLPRNLKLGVSWEAKVPKSFSLLTGFAVEKSLVFEDIPDSVSEELSFYDRNELLLGGGLEAGFLGMAFGRVGYIYDDPGEIKGWTFGAGFYLKSFGFDFASIPQYKELSRVSKFSLTAHFK
jgi:hypothetical protein